MSERRGREAKARELAMELCRDRSSELLGYARSHARSMAVAEEALQEALISFLRHYDPGGGAPPIGWLKLALKRECWRRQERERWDRRAGQELGPDEEGSGFRMEQVAAPGSSPEDQLLDRLEADRRLGRLKPDERTSVELQGAGFSYAEIAEHKGWTYTKVHRSVKEGRARLANHK